MAYVDAPVDQTLLDGSQALPSLRFLSEPTLGLYKRAIEEIGFTGDLTLIGDRTLQATGTLTIGAATLGGHLTAGGYDIGSGSVASSLPLRGGLVNSDIGGGYIYLFGSNNATGLLFGSPNAAKSAGVSRFYISSGIDVAVGTWAAITHTGLVLSGALDVAGQYLSFTERAAPGAGAADTARIYAIVDGGALTDLAAVFQDGTVDIFAQEVTPLDSPIFRYPSKTEGKIRMRKPHPGSQIFEMVFPDGTSFVLKELEHHDTDKIAADQGAEGPLPADWFQETAIERARRQELEAVEVGVLPKV